MQSLSALMNQLSIKVDDCEIKQICDDSRKVSKDDLFVCIPCANDLENAKQAVANGAKVLVAQAKILKHFEKQITPFAINKSQEMDSRFRENDRKEDHCHPLEKGDPFMENGIICIKHENPRLALSQLAKAYYNHQPSTLVAVTGTNGKSSVVSLIRQLWHLLGYKSASFGTVGLEIDDSYYPDSLQKVPSLTTYDSLSFFKLLSDLTISGINHVVFEASSHGLDQYRIHGSNITAASFTNLTQDHLDYHKDMESYLQAKIKLFKEVLPSDQPAILNANSPYFAQIKNQISNPVFSYGTDSKADIHATNVEVSGTKIIFDLHYQKQTFHSVTLNLAGAFQLENTLCAIATLMSNGTPLESIVSLLPLLKSVSGRMELIGSTETGADVYVDYAHTPDALEKSLLELKKIKSGNGLLRVIFGCGGDRDRGKRPLMGQVAADIADFVVVTDDNPRYENASEIRKQILAECPGASEIPSRADAIAKAIEERRPGDIVLIAGKGHETYQLIGDQVLPFNDVEEVQKYVRL